MNQTGFRAEWRVSSQNIRFYEKEGLISPQRNQSNGYREYTEQDVRTLKLV